MSNIKIQSHIKLTCKFTLLPPRLKCILFPNPAEHSYKHFTDQTPAPSKAHDLPNWLSLWGTSRGASGKAVEPFHVHPHGCFTSWVTRSHPFFAQHVIKKHLKFRVDHHHHHHQFFHVTPSFTCFMFWIFLLAALVSGGKPPALGTNPRPEDG